MGQAPGPGRAHKPGPIARPMGPEPWDEPVGRAHGPDCAPWRLKGLQKSQFRQMKSSCPRCSEVCAISNSEREVCEKVTFRQPQSAAQINICLVVMLVLIRTIVVSLSLSLSLSLRCRYIQLGGRPSPPGEHLFSS